MHGVGPDIDNMNNTDRPRIVIYGVGQYGQFITRFAAAKGWPIVAAFNRAGPKVGQDLGRVAGLDRDLGVVIQDGDRADYDGLQADIGVVALTNILSINLPAYRRLLGAGLNVICHGSESYHPYVNNPEVAAEIEALARDQGVTFTGAGIWDMSRIWSGILVAGPCTEVTSLFHSSLTDIAGQVVNKEQAHTIGTGFSLEEFERAGHYQNPIAKTYKGISVMVLEALGYTVTDTRVGIEPIVFDEPYESGLMECVIPAGDCVGIRMAIDTSTREGVSARSEIDIRLFQEGDVEHMFWSVAGLPTSRVRVERDQSAHATAGCLFNRIPDVIAAAPGIVLVSQLGPLKHSALL